MDEIRELKEQFAHLQEQIKQQEKLASLGLLTAGIVHKMQNPLKMKFRFLLFFIFLSSAIWAQEEKDFRQVYQQAEEEYTIGHFDKSILLLNQNLNLFTGALKASACRLMALCHLGLDNMAEAERNVLTLLKIDPYYSVSIHDPLRFVDMVEKYKKGSTITTASMQAETIDEAPVPVTLITEEMIQASGARNLSDLLLLYVPGMSLVESDEANIAMHGVYSSSQEKILIMLDGHRLNSRATNSEAPDYRSSLEKVKQIEVLRGPASSLYGNVALTAVVNIITKKGGDVDGAKISVGYGSNQTYRSDFTFGKSGVGIDFMAWASVYSSKGEKRNIGVDHEDFYGQVLMPGSMYIGGYNHKPAYDIGFTCRWNNLKLLFNTQYAKKVPSYTHVTYNSLYDYDRYPSIEGVTPGRSRQSSHLNLSYEKAWKKSSLKISAFADIDHATHYDVAGDSVKFVGKGISKTLDWNDHAYGLNSQYSLEYQMGKQKGNFLVGALLENYVIKDNTVIIGSNFDNIVSGLEDLYYKVRLGNEISFSSFIQWKHYLRTNLIFNGGVRYDYKKHYNKKTLNAFSPRLSLNYLIQDGMSLKFGYAHSFVDAPYLYRASENYAGGSNLEAEKMDAFQLSFRKEIRNMNITYEINSYYDQLSNMVYYSNLDLMYLNAGKVGIMGIEGAVSYKTKRITANLTCSYQHLLSAANDYSMVTNKRINHIPNFIMHLMSSYKILSSKRMGDIDIRGNIELLSKQLAPLRGITLWQGDKECLNFDNTEKARAIANIGFSYSLKKVSIAFDAYNILNTKYHQGGSVATLNPQQGISFISKISYSF
ncbi:MAG: TonB-dependent receptor [Tannerellaceae bacterium]